MEIHPETPVHASANFTFRGNKGSFQGAAAWTDKGGKGVFSNQVDDPTAGSSTVDVDMSAYADGENTSLHVEADGDAGPGVTMVPGDSEQLDFKSSVQPISDGVNVAVTQA